MEDSLWKMEAYRLALFAAEIGWHDVTELMKANEPAASPTNYTVHLVPLAQIWLKGIRIIQAGHAPNIINTRWDLPAS